jgi:phenylacetate-coenzyme A ligase PaaK-like adenylate-forming protein
VRSSVHTPTSDIDARARRRAELRAAVPEHLERLTWNADRLRAHQQARLRTLLRTAIDRSPFHASRLDGVDPDTFELDDLASLPIMTKTEMMSAFDDVVTDRRVTRTAVEEHLSRTGFEATELFDEHLVLASGGSSGERGIFVYPRAQAIEFLLALVRPGLARMVALFGELPAEPVSSALVAAGSGVHATRALASLFGGDLIQVSSIAASDPIGRIVERLEDVRPVMLQGYPTVIRRLADEKLAGRLTIQPMTVTTTSEPLTPDARARIDEAFGVGVRDMFGSSEGVLGVSPPDDPAIVLASDLTILELVDDENEPVEHGAPSSKVLVTNVSNHLQPLIRYELTDCLVQHPSSAESGHLRVTVDGRRDDELRYDGGVVVHPISVRSVLVKTPQVVEYQVRQTRRGIDLAVVVNDRLDEAELGSRLRSSLTGAGLPDPQVDIRAVDPSDIERHPATGKTRRFIPLAS